jgi:outer membrane protein assembly factor BamB
LEVFIKYLRKKVKNLDYGKFYICFMYKGVSYKNLRRKVKKLKIINRNRMMTTFAILLIATMTVGTFALPGLVTAQTTKITTYPFIEAIPNPVGVTQRTLINIGLLNYLNVDGDGWNVTLTITDPSGHTTTVGPLKTWSTGTIGHSFVPTVAGNYTLKCIFAGENYTGQAYAASETPAYMLTVQENPVPTWPGQSMPTEYWSRPIDSQLREWWSVSGSWASKPENLIAEGNDAPTTAHILWANYGLDTMGGLIGGDNTEGIKGYQNGDAYEGKFAGSVIIGGVLYYNRYLSGFYSASPQQTIVALDLHTGETLWEKSLPSLPGTGRITIGQTLVWDCLNNRGAFSYLWLNSGSTYYALDAKYGDLKYNMTNVPGGTMIVGPNGELIQYELRNYGNSTNPNYRLLQWNSSYVVTKGKTGMSESWGSQIQGVTLDATANGYDINVSIPAYNTAAVGTFPSGVTYGWTGPAYDNLTIAKAFVKDRVILSTVSYNNVQIWAFNVKPGYEGQLLYNKVNAAPSEWKAGSMTISSIGQAGWCAWSQPDMVGVFFSKENRVHYAYSLTTGEFLWKTEPQTYADAWSDTVLAGFGPDRVIAYGKLYSATVGGIVYAYDIQTGELAWQYNVKDKYGESYLTNNWWMIPLFISGDKIYLGTLEHSALEPKPRGGPFLCLNATDGTVVFEADGLFRQTRWGGRAIIGDSIIATQDTYNQMIYGIGKGPSATTVSPINTAVTAETSVVIQGKVTDISPGTQDASIAMRFPNGVPAVSDASQSEWMLYVYKQFNQPTTVTGVPVSIDAVDPNGNYVHLGETTSDSSGSYSYVYTPNTAGKYTVYVTFGGSAAYYSSYAQTAMVVQAAAATPTPTTTTQSAVEQMFVPAVAGIIIAIILVGVLLALLLLRKRP